MCKDSVSYSASFCSGLPKTKVAFVFICPGKKEEDKNMPVAGQTGKNLDIVIKHLNKANHNLFPKLCRYDYRILNLSEKVYYQAKSNRTVPILRDIRPDANINRIVKQIGECETVIFFNKTKKYDDVMKKVLKKIPNKKVIRVCHLSFQSINRSIKEDKYGNSLKKGKPGNTERRLEVMANKILKCL